MKWEIYYFYCFPLDIKNIDEPGLPLNYICCPWKYKLMLFLSYMMCTEAQWHLFDSFKSLICSLNWVVWCGQKVWTKTREKESDKLLVCGKQLPQAESHSYSPPVWGETKECDICALKGHQGLHLSCFPCAKPPWKEHIKEEVWVEKEYWKGGTAHG